MTMRDDKLTATELSCDQLKAIMVHQLVMPLSLGGSRATVQNSLNEPLASHLLNPHNE